MTMSRQNYVGKPNVCRVSPVANNRTTQKRAVSFVPEPVWTHLLVKAATMCRQQVLIDMALEQAEELREIKFTGSSLSRICP